MAAVLPATDLLPRPERGRVFTNEVKIRLGDVDRLGRLRLDATSRILQDVATDDASDAGLDRRFGWLVRRTMIEVAAPARLGEACAASTWCTGIGGAWAERRSQILGERGARIDAVSLWVQIDSTTGRPARIAADFTDAYGETAGDRVTSAQLSLPAPDGAVEQGAWVVRRTDIDPYGHVNNAATWSLLEEYAQLDESNGRVGRAELEYQTPIEHSDEIVVLATHDDAGTSMWAMRGATACAAGRWTVSGG